MAGLLLIGGAVVGWAAERKTPETNPAQAGAQTRPAATRPAGSTVLVRVGDEAVITQGEFESYFYNGPPVPFEADKANLMRQLVERKWFLLYLDEHPDLAPAAEIQASIDEARKKNKIKNDEEFVAALKKVGLTPETWYMQKRLTMGRTALSNQGREKAKDEAQLKKIFAERPEDFDNTEVSARHILIGSAPYDTPEQKKDKREKAEKIREDLLSGKRAWDEAVKESACSTRAVGGNLGFFTRHFRMLEPLAAAAFSLEPNKISPVIETPLGFHIVEVTARHHGGRSFEASKADIKLWLEGEPYFAAINQMKLKYPTTGVQSPLPPPPRPKPAVATRPGGRFGPLPRPGLGTTRPAGRPGPRPAPRSATTRPALGQARPGR